MCKADEKVRNRLFNYEIIRDLIIDAQNVISNQYMLSDDQIEAAMELCAAEFTQLIENYDEMD